MDMHEYKGNLIVKHGDKKYSAFYYADEESEDNIIEVKCGSMREAKAIINKHIKNNNNNESI
jgi:hypothetical protein